MALQYIPKYFGNNLQYFTPLHSPAAVKHPWHTGGTPLAPDARPCEACMGLAGLCNFTQACPLCHLCRMAAHTQRAYRFTAVCLVDLASCPGVGYSGAVQRVFLVLTTESLILHAQGTVYLEHTVH